MLLKVDLKTRSRRKISGKSALGCRAASLLIHRLAGSEKALQMPPTGALTAEEIGRFRAWIDQGAPWDGRLEARPAKLEVSAAATALFGRIRRRDRDGVKRALEADSELVRARDEDGASALILASVYAGPAMMRELVERGADVNAKDSFSATALLWSAHSPDKTRLLPRSGVGGPSSKSPELRNRRPCQTSHRSPRVP